MTDYEAKRAYISKDEAERYDEVRFSHTQGKMLDTIEKESVSNLLKNGCSLGLILDLACGSGRFVEMISGSYDGVKLVGADISKEQLKVAKKRLRNNRSLEGLVLCDAEFLPFRNGSFDCTITIRFMGLLPPAVRQTILKEIHKVTREEVILNYPNSISASIILRILWKLERTRPEFFPVSPSSFCKKIRAIGFEIVDKQTPLIIPPRRFPKIFLNNIKIINSLGKHSLIGLLSEQHFVLLKKKCNNESNRS